MLVKLLEIDYKVAVIMASDMLFAAVDTVSVYIFYDKQGFPQFCSRLS